MRRVRTSLFALTAAFAPTATFVSITNAQPIDGLYVGGDLGVNFMGSEKIQANSLANSSSAGLGNLGFGPNGGNTNVYFSPGFVGLGSVGWGLGNGFRVELEPSYRTNAVSSISGLFASPGLSSGGTEQKFGLLVNAAYDFYGLVPWTVPYAGVGVGYAWANWNGVNVTDRIGDTATISNTKGAFAYQAILGTAFPMAATPGLSITTEFRFMGMAGTRDYSGAIVLPRLDRALTGSVQVGAEYNYALLVGIRYAFNTPPPPPPTPIAAPSPAPARSYLVFFDWDKATLTDRARQIVKDAADNSTRVQYTRIEVNGYTDTSGTAKYNQALSVRRAEAVAAELVKDGVPRGGITIQGFGETHLLAPTGPGVREPQNRRVEIIIRLAGQRRRRAGCRRSRNASPHARTQLRLATTASSNSAGVIPVSRVPRGCRATQPRFRRLPGRLRVSMVCDFGSLAAHAVGDQVGDNLSAHRGRVSGTAA